MAVRWNRIAQITGLAAAGLWLPLQSAGFILALPRMIQHLIWPHYYVLTGFLIGAAMVLLSGSLVSGPRDQDGG